MPNFAVLLQLSTLLLQLGPVLLPLLEAVAESSWVESSLRPKGCEVLMGLYFKGGCVGSGESWKTGVCQVVKGFYQKGDCCRLAREALVGG